MIGKKKKKKEKTALYHNDFSCMAVIHGVTRVDDCNFRSWRNTLRPLIGAIPWSEAGIIMCKERFSLEVSRRVVTDVRHTALIQWKDLTSSPVPQNMAIVAEYIKVQSQDGRSDILCGSREDRAEIRWDGYLSHSITKYILACYRF